MTAREDAIEAGWQAWHAAAWDSARDAIAAVVDAVWPIFEAEADRRVDRMILWNTNHLASLRAQVEELAEVRERIAQKIEATGHAISCVTRYNGPLAPDVYGCDCGLERHVRIARGGESDECARRSDFQARRRGDE